MRPTYKPKFLKKLSYAMFLAGLFNATSLLDAMTFVLSLDNQTNERLVYEDERNNYTVIRDDPDFIKNNYTIDAGEKSNFRITILSDEYFDKYDSSGITLLSQKEKDYLLFELEHQKEKLGIMFDRVPHTGFNVIFRPFINEKPKGCNVNIIPAEHVDLYRVVIKKDNTKD